MVHRGGGGGHELRWLRVEIAARCFLLAPIPLGEFIKHVIASDMNTTSALIVGPIGLCPRLVLDEDHPCAPGVQLAQVRLGVLDVHTAPERVQMSKTWLCPIPSLLWCHPLHVYLAIWAGQNGPV
jgi:hypothetical protein